VNRGSSRIRVATKLRWALPPTISAVLLVVAFPPFGWPIFAWIALIPLFLHLPHYKPLNGFASGHLFGTLFYMLLMGWTAEIADIHFHHFIFLGLVLGSFLGLYTGLATRLFFYFPKWSPLTLPALWVTIEYLRSHIGFLSQPFGILGYSQYQVLSVAGVSAYTGIFGVSFLLVASNALLASLIKPYAAFTLRKYSSARNSYRPIAPMAIVLLLLFGWPQLHARDKETTTLETLDVAIVQGNAQAHKELSQERYQEEVLPVYEQLTRSAEGAALVVWPSSSVPGVIPTDRAMTKRLAGLARETDSYLLIGAAGFDKFDAEQSRQKRIANSAFLFTPSGRMGGRYDKIRLLPFDEYLPARDLIPWPEWLISSETKDHSPGKELTIFDTGRARFGVQICFENMFPDQTRQLARKGAQLLVAQTNESYTNSMAGHLQNLPYYVFRAIENRIPVLRSSTTGISCIIDASGKIIGSVKDPSGREIDVAGVTKGRIVLSSDRSFYTRHGDLFTYVCIVTVASFLSLSFYSGRGRPGKRT